VSLHDFIRRRGRFIPFEQRAPLIVVSANAFRQKAIQEMAFDPNASGGNAASAADTVGTEKAP